MKQSTKGAAAVLLAAFLFGFTPIFGKLSYGGGNNAVMLGFTRSAMALPLLLAMHRAKGLSIKISGRNWVDVAVLGIFGSSVYSVLYNSSYGYIPVGMATMLASTYPFFVILFSLLFFREKPGKAAVLALVLVLPGVALLTGWSWAGAEARGIVLATASAVTYGWMILFQYRSSLIGLHPFTMAFYRCLATCVSMAVYGSFTGQITLAVEPYVWLCALGIAVCSSVAGMSLLQYGLRRVGSIAASILCMFEPITGVAVGVLLLGESMTVAKLLGCGLVLAAIAILAAAPKQAEARKEGGRKTA